MQGFESDEEIINILESARVPCAPVLAPYEAIGHPYFESRGAVKKVDDPFLGEFYIPGDPLHFSDFPEPLELEAPTLGQHNEHILKELISSFFSCTHFLWIRLVKKSDVQLHDGLMGLKLFQDEIL